MLRTDTLEKNTLDLVKKLQSISCLRETRLVGGTALALLLGHRISVDIDLFGIEAPNTQELQESLKDNGLDPLLNYSGASVSQFAINNVNVDVVRYPYQWLAPSINEEGVRLASLQDIAAMKLEAITNRGTKRDFVDVYFLLKHFSLNEQMKLYTQKYPDGSSFNVMRSLTFFADAEEMPMPKMLIPVDWEEIKSAVKNAVTAL